MTRPETAAERKQRFLDEVNSRPPSGGPVSYGDLKAVAVGGLQRVSLGGDRDIAACPAHILATRHGSLAHTMAAAEHLAAGWIAQNRAGQARPAVFALGILYDPPLCCPSAGLAQSCMMAAFRTLTRGEG